VAYAGRYPILSSHSITSCGLYWQISAYVGTSLGPGGASCRIDRSWPSTEGFHKFHRCCRQAAQTGQDDEFDVLAVDDNGSLVVEED